MIVVSSSLGTLRLMPPVVELMTDGVVAVVVDKSLLLLLIPLLGTIPNSAA
jgi:hypothetical protein